MVIGVVARGIWRGGPVGREEGFRDSAPDATEVTARKTTQRRGRRDRRDRRDRGPAERSRIGAAARAGRARRPRGSGRTRSRSGSPRSRRALRWFPSRTSRRRCAPRSHGASRRATQRGPRPQPIKNDSPQRHRGHRGHREDSFDQIRRCNPLLLRLLGILVRRTGFSK